MLEIIGYIIQSIIAFIVAVFRPICNGGAPKMLQKTCPPLPAPPVRASAAYLGIELTDAMPEADYAELRNRLHWGQRKLLISEIDFLTQYRDTPGVVVYAGAADGKHIPFLADMFPEREFHLYDPREFDPAVHKHARIRINPHSKSGFFTIETCGNYAKVQVLFISDIRSSPDRYSFDAFEQCVVNDLELQTDILHAMRPAAAMLKFRLPFSVRKGRDPRMIKYLDGSVRLQAWGPPDTTETRLITTGLSEKPYDACVYERQMAYWNGYMRTANFGNLDAHELGFTTHVTLGELWHQEVETVGADCYVETVILMRYLTRDGPVTADAFVALRDAITKKLTNTGFMSRLRA